MNPGSAISRPFGGTGFPDYLSSHFIESDHCGTFSPNHADQLLVLDKGVSGETPIRSLCAECIFEFQGPHNVTFLRIQTQQVAFRTQSVHAVIIHSWCASGTDGIGIHTGIRAVIFLLPKKLTRFFIQTQNTLGSGDVCLDEIDIAFLVGLWLEGGGPLCP